jgi:4-amino-4-deoxy-L-arabinose transferase-like glycosyltransferase
MTIPKTPTSLIRLKPKTPTFGYLIKTMPGTKVNKNLILLTFGLLLAGLFINLGLQPLYLEEPRRAIIAMEMAERENLWVPTELGEYYYNKPPVFNWILILSAKLFGGFNEWAMRLPTVLSTLGIVFLMWYMGRCYIDEYFGWQSGLMFATCGSVLLFFSQLGEIDIFYALVSLLGFVALFQGFQQRRWWWMFGGFYAFHAIGMLTKGLPSLMFIGLTLPAWLWYKGELKRLLSIPHWFGILTWGLITGGYLFQYSKFNDLESLLTVWLGQVEERTIAEQGFQRLLTHFILYPLDSLKDLLPFSLLAIFFWRKRILDVLKQNEWILFAAIVVAVNFPVYWVSPGAKQRYLYMFFPLMLAIGLWMLRRSENLKIKKIFRILSGVFLGAISIGGTLLYFLPQFDFLPFRIGFAIAAGISFFLVLWWWKLEPHRELHALILSMLLFRITFDMTVLPHRNLKSDASYDKITAFQIDAITGNSPLYLYGNDRCSFSTIYYLNRLRNQCVVKSYTLQKDAFYIADETCITGPYACYWTFMYDNRKYVLFRFTS